MSTEIESYSEKLLSDNIKGKQVLIIGGTSGIGLSTAIQAKKLGATVTVLGSSPEKSLDVAEKHHLNGLYADVTDHDAVCSALSGLHQIDHLVLLAGTFIVGKVTETDINIFRRAFDERLWAAINILNTLSDRLAPDASVTFVSGALAERPTAFGTSITAAVCSAMETFGRNLALELAPRRVNTISPGPIETPNFASSMGEAREAYILSLREQLPVGRLGTPDEAASAILFLMNNRYMNGATLNIDGGMRLG